MRHGGVGGGSSQSRALLPEFPRCHLPACKTTLHHATAPPHLPTTCGTSTSAITRTDRSFHDLGDLVCLLQIPLWEYPHICDIRMRPRNVQSLTGSKDLQMVNITLRVISRPMPLDLPEIYRMLGTHGQIQRHRPTERMGRIKITT